MSNLYTADNFPLLRGRRAAACAVLAAAALAQGACHDKPPPEAIPAIVVALPVVADPGGVAGQILRYPVEAAARYSNAASFRVAGKLMERRVRLGDAVHQGEVIALLDAADAQNQAAGAQAAFDAAEHRLAFARQQLDRDQAQSLQNLIAANQLEQTQDAYASALAGREQAAAQLALARNTLQYNTLTADHDGVITSENADTGQFVAAGQAVYGLAWTGDTDAVLDAAAGDLARISIGQSASVVFTALPGRRFEARVREVAPAADPQSRTYRVKLTLLQPQTAVRFGMSGEAQFSPATPATGTAEVPAFKVPATAIFHRGNTPAVWVIRSNDSTLELRPVAVRSYGERSATVTGGLREGDNIVLAGVHTVFAGERVKAVMPLFAGDAQSGEDTQSGGDSERGDGRR